MKRREFILHTGIAGLAFAVSCSRNHDEEEPEKSCVVTAGRCTTYEPQSLRQAMTGMVDRLGALKGLRSGDRVLLKVNLTGGAAAAIHYMNLRDIFPWETYWTHSEVIRIMAELYRDAGAGHIWVADALFGSDSYALGGYREKLAPLAELIDLDQPGPSAGFVSLPVANSLRYPSFWLREEVVECDHLAAIVKMKCHQNCGITLGLKGHIGLVPLSHYRSHPEDASRTLLHGSPTESGQILPQGIVDLNQARPIDFSLIDGILTAEGGEGPWINTFKAVQPGLLVAGTDPVATDAVACSLMGFDPQAADFTTPFDNSCNHIRLAGSHGLGQSRLGDIIYSGPELDTLRFPFTPCDPV
ncbi:MAG: DUF362 domain-containing protein [Candidatus Aminicenantes bacterium]|nr:DUF362 domain-containing protein [Candidatus Aminicenantes bacterium]